MSLSSSTALSITVSVIIPTYNRAHYLPEALDSILNQTRPPEEVIIIDDGSTDHTSIVAERYGGRVRYFKTENRGKPTALNFGIPLARGSHVWLFDDDDVALPDALQSHVDFLVAHPEVAFSYSTNYRYSGDAGIWQRELWVAKAIPNWSTSEFLLETLLGMHTMLPGMLIPKRCLLEVGLLDSALLRNEDLDLLIKLAARFSARNIQRPSFVLRDHGGARGPGTQVHTAVRRAAVDLRYQQQVYRDVRNRLPLASYFPHEPGTELPELDLIGCAKALIQRSCIMLHQGLVDEGLEDLADGLSRLRSAGRSTEGIGTKLATAMDADPRRFRRPVGFVFSLTRTLKAGDAKDLALSAIRGIYWSSRRSFRDHLWFEAAVSVEMLFLMAMCNLGGIIIGRKASPVTDPTITGKER